MLYKINSSSTFRKEELVRGKLLPKISLEPCKLRRCEWNRKNFASLLGQFLVIVEDGQDYACRKNNIDCFLPSGYSETGQ